MPTKWKNEKTDEEVKTPTAAKKKAKTATKKAAPTPAPSQEEVREAVVDELPQVGARQIRGEDGHVYNLKTVPEAIQEILEKVRAIEERLE